MELILAHNPDPDSRLKFLMWVPLDDGLEFRTSGTWPRTKALYCYSELFKQRYVNPAQAADGLAELQVRWPEIPIVYAENRTLAEEWTYRFLAAAHVWATTETAAIARIGATAPEMDTAPEAPGPSPAEVRAWALDAGLEISRAGRVPKKIWDAWHRAH